MTATPGLFAAITLDVRGGGVAAASRLMWHVLQHGWDAPCRLITLMDDGSAAEHHRLTTLVRMRFGARVAATQALGRVDWTFYNHVSVAQVQEYLPPGLRRPYVVFLHGIEVWRRLSEAHKRALAGAHLLIANSAYTARRVAHAHPWIGPIAVCPLALPMSAREMARRDPKVAASGDRPRTVLVVGRMVSAERYKGHDQLLEAWGAVRAVHRDARLVFVGTGDDVGRLKAKARRFGHDGSVVFAGFVPAEALGACYENAAVFAMPSRNEGFGLVYLEAMAYALPCIGSIHDAAGDVIVDGSTGFLIDQGDVSALADRIVQLLSDPALAERLGANGLRRLRKHFGYEMFRDRLTGLLFDSFGSLQSAGTALSASPAERSGGQ
jgi:phosphatidylinositol alpha-1,6-mannosyltransferase